MKHSISIYGLLAFAFIFLAAGTANAQLTTTPAEQEVEKLEQQSKAGANYDTWKLEQSKTADDQPNTLIHTTRSKKGDVTYDVQLGGKRFANKEAANNYEAKLMGQAGVLVVDANASTNRVRVKVKEEYADQILVGLFDIH